MRESLKVKFISSLEKCRINEGTDCNLTFKKYPKEADYISALREKVNSEINKRI